MKEDGRGNDPTSHVPRVASGGNQIMNRIMSIESYSDTYNIQGNIFHALYAPGNGAVIYPGTTREQPRANAKYRP